MAGRRPFPDGEQRRAGPRERVARPLDPARLEELATAYVARFATSAAKLERYLERKLRERGWAASEPGAGDGTDDDAAGNAAEEGPDLGALVARFVELGYVDDQAFARARSSTLLRRGYGPRRIGQALGEAGIHAGIRDYMRPSEAARRQAALAMVRKRRFGPFGDQRADPARREKQIAALLRAGHMLADARALLDAPSIAAAEDWAAEGEDG